QALRVPPERTAPQSPAGGPAVQSAKLQGRGKAGQERAKQEKGAPPDAKLAKAPAKPEQPLEELTVVPPADEMASFPGTPSYLGLSLREALTRAHAAGWKVAVRGTGWVAEQYPMPGTPLGDDRRLALELRPDRPTAQP